MNWLDIYHSTGGSLQQFTIDEVLKSNEESQKYGLVLTPAQAHELVKTRNLAIQNHGRIELSIEVVNKIVYAFCSSSYINSEEYAWTLNQLVELFYYMKNETEDRIGDDELISVMKDFFEGASHGSLSLLKNRDLTLFAQHFRQANQSEDYALERSQYNETNKY
ncbi:MAG TPA: DUF6323 family protein [Syntrophomonadaceae bacterium]|nr:DUF6323 family protein [Syntrophomonadaceae bacterium]